MDFLKPGPDGAYLTNLRGRHILATPLLNKGTGFTEAERDELGLVGLLPTAVLTLDQQVARAYEQYHTQPTDLAKNVFLSGLQDRNEVLFYRLLLEHLDEMLPIVYSPTVGEAIQRYSHEYRRPRGLFLSIDHPELVEKSLVDLGVGADDIDLVVATDAEAILGIGDWGVGGINISIGKLIVYTVAAGIDPARVIPVMLDVGTDREALLNDPVYIGNKHPRVRGADYDAFIDQYVSTVRRLFPHALLHWEDFGADNARAILGRYRDACCTFNDDMQGTGAITLAAVLSVCRASGIPLSEHRVVVFGSGTAGIGIADQIRDAMVAGGLDLREANRRFWCIDRDGLLTDNMSETLHSFQIPYARPFGEVTGWERVESGVISLGEVVRRVRPTILIGTSAVPGAFGESVIREMASHCDRPAILPLSNPTARVEAVPEDLIEWTRGKGLVATGSPFAPVTYGGVEHRVAQANNALLFPGLGLGAIVGKASCISDGMLRAAADAVATMADPGSPGAPLLPPIHDIRSVSAAVASAVVHAAVSEGIARAVPSDVELSVAATMWWPSYRAVLAV